MVEIPDAARDSINEGFAQRLERIDPEFSQVIIEAKPGRTEELVSQLQAMTGTTVNPGNIAAGVFVPATVPENSIPDIARLDSVALVHQDQVVGIPNSMAEALSSLRDVPFLLPQNDPIRQKLSKALYDAFEPEDQYLGRVRIGEVEIERFNFAQIPPGDPGQIALSAFDSITGLNSDGKKFVPTHKVVKWVRNESATDGISNDSKVAILDTGYSPLPDVTGARVPPLMSYVPGEPGADGLGHGSWCSNMVAGKSAPSVHGQVGGVAPNATFGHFKCLNTFPGFGRTSWILNAMDGARKWGADVISMSLGGPQQGPVGEDPYSRYIERTCKENLGDDEGAIYVAAAGNSGPSDYTIGSPGIAPKALTVAAWSMTDGSPSVFSSRGPQGEFYGENGGEFDSDLERLGPDEFVKPDVVAPGGGRENADKASRNDELLHQASVGWMEGLYDGLKSFRAAMKGTSMATPAVSGLVYRLYDAGHITTASDVKDVVAKGSSVGTYENAAANANRTVGGKNVTVGFGPIYESLWA